MSVEITSRNGDVLLSVVGADGTPYKRYQNGPPSWSGSLPATQDYYLEAVSVGTATDYTLLVSITPLENGSTGDFPPSDAMRINFAPGTTSARLNSSITDRGRDYYVLSAEAGQEMSVEITSPNQDVLLSVVGADGTPYKRYQNGPPSWSSTLPITQDYYIEAVSVGPATDYTLNVSISALDGGSTNDFPPSDAKRINFAPGTTSAQINGSVSEQGRNDYVLSAQAGQEMSVEISSPNNDVLLSVVGADGTPYKRYQNGPPSWSSTLPATQDYYIEAVSIGSATDYTLNVSISALAGNRVEAERIEFAPGATSAQRGGLLPSGPGTLKYVLAANANQTMTVDATCDGTPLSMTIEDPTGYRRIPEMREVVGGYAIGAQLTLPATGDYVVTLQKADHTPSTNYSVTFTIQ